MCPLVEDLPRKKTAKEMAGPGAARAAVSARRMKAPRRCRAGRKITNHACDGMDQILVILMPADHCLFFDFIWSSITTIFSSTRGLV
jgi:hypothetical protein